jgi:drug/metabolite transporter (DMT)-like permease
MPVRPSPSIASLVALAIVAEGLLTLMDAMIKSLAPRYNAIEIAFLRYAFGMFGAIVYALSTRPGWPSGEATLYNGLRAVLIVFTATTFFFALGKLSLADAIAMSFISPALTAVLGVFLLRERLDWRIAIALVGGFLGMLLIVGSKLGSAGPDTNVLLGATAVFLSAIGYSLNVIMLRHRATRDPLAQIILFQNVGPALILVLPALWVWSTPTWPDLLRFAVLGTIGVFAHTLLAHAFARVEAARLAPIGYVTLVWGVLFGFLFFAEVPSLATLAGSGLIVVGTLFAQRR